MFFFGQHLSKKKSLLLFMREYLRNIVRIFKGCNTMHFEFCCVKVTCEGLPLTAFGVTLVMNIPQMYFHSQCFQKCYYSLKSFGFFFHCCITMGFSFKPLYQQMKARQKTTREYFIHIHKLIIFFTSELTLITT